MGTTYETKIIEAAEHFIVKVGTSAENFIKKRFLKQEWLTKQDKCVKELIDTLEGSKKAAPKVNPEASQKEKTIDTTAKKTPAKAKKVTKKK